jgi:Holliday junction resolvase YEN1
MIPDLASKRTDEARVIDLASSSPAPRHQPAIETSGKAEMASPLKPKPKSKKYFVVRDSLDNQAGQFFEVDEEKVKDRSRAYRYSQVEVLDLTGDD